MRDSRTMMVCLALAAFHPACSGCDEEVAEEGIVRAQGGSVANAEALTKRARTEDGYEVIEASPRMRAQREAAEAARREAQENLVREPTSPDPHGGTFTIQEAVEGLGTDGSLVVEMSTTLGTIMCDLYTDEVPNTVANFVGLARGKRAWWDARAGQWRVNRPAYNGTIFHRVIPDFLIQGGDYLGDGTGTVGYTIPDEPHEDLKHDRAGLLCMANLEGANDAGAQFFITDGATPQLEDDRYTVFGRCRQTDVVEHIARVPQAEGNRPTTDVVINMLTVRRVRGGAANAVRTPPSIPEGVNPEEFGREASPGPAELAIPGHPERHPGAERFDPRRFNPMGSTMRERPAPE